MTGAEVFVNNESLGIQIVPVRSESGIGNHRELRIRKDSE